MADKTKVKNSLSRQLNQLNTVQDNIVRIMQAISDAIVSDKESITVDLKDENENVIGSIVVPGIINIENRVSITEESIKNMVNLPYFGSVLQGTDSTIREIYVQGYKDKEDTVERSEVTIDSFADVRENASLDGLLSPLTTVQIKLSERLNTVSDVYIEKITLNDGSDISYFTDSQSYKDVFNTLTNNDIGYTLIQDTIRVDPPVVRHYGKFSVLTKKVNDDSTITVKLDNLSYSDILSSVSGSRELAEGDTISTSDGKGQYNITLVDSINKNVTLERTGGYDDISVGTESIEFVYKETTGRTLRIPLHANEKAILFIQPINGKNRASEYSDSIILDSDDLTVNIDNTLYTFNDYSSATVLDIGGYLRSVIEESAIPSKFAVTPDKPVLESSNFKVVQINEHLTNSKNYSTIKELNAKKNKAWQDVQAVSNEITTVQKKINKGNYKSNIDKENDIAKLNTLIDTKTSKSAYHTSIVNDLTNISKATQTSSVKPKYRVQGFFDVQEDIENVYTTAQKIVQYEGQYRYTSSDKGFSQTKSIAYKDSSGNDISGVVPAWTDFSTEPLKRTRNTEGKLEWEDNRPEDGDQNSINQIDMPIQYGENVEFRVRAVSEVGWPLSPERSSWSDIMTVEFDESLLNDDVVESILKNNDGDRITSEVNTIINNTGITEHVSTEVTDQGITFYHNAKDIDSGQRTTEQTIISLFDYINTLTQMVSTLQDTVDRRFGTLSVELYDTIKNTTYDVRNFTTVDLFGGFYKEEVDITQEGNFGTIVEKVFLLNIKNDNNQTIEILSINAGNLSVDIDNDKYTGAPIIINNDGTVPINQKNGQILYSRIKDISGSDTLYAIDNNTNSTTVPSSDIDSNSVVGNRKTVYRDTQGTIEIVKLKDDASMDYNVIHSDHPVYVEYTQDSGTENTDLLNDEFDRIKTITSTIKSDNQETYQDGRVYSYKKAKDKYLIGKDTVGAYLFPTVSSIGNIQVNGSDSASVNTFEPSTVKSIPLVFQFRMMDALGNVDGNPQNNPNINFTYTKKVGIDLLINNELFSFDINVKCKFRPESIVSESSINDLISNISLNNSNTAKIL